MSTPTILVCDDNFTVHESLRYYLQEESIGLLSVYDGETALDAVLHGKIDLAVLDIMLPGTSGMEICRQIRRQSDIPIVMLSARSEESVRISALEQGADDFVVKPFSPRELSIKIRRILDRTLNVREVKRLEFQELVVYPESFEVYCNNEALMLTPKETKLLAYFIVNAEKVISREQIINAIWGFENYYNTRVVDNLVKRIRQKLPVENVHFVLQSIYGVGYKLEKTL